MYVAETIYFLQTVSYCAINIIFYQDTTNAEIQDIKDSPSRLKAKIKYILYNIIRIYHVTGICCNGHCSKDKTDFALFSKFIIPLEFLNSLLCSTMER